MNFRFSHVNDPLASKWVRHFRYLSVRVKGHKRLSSDRFIHRAVPHFTLLHSVFQNLVRAFITICAREYNSKIIPSLSLINLLTSNYFIVLLLQLFNFYWIITLYASTFIG